MPKKNRETDRDQHKNPFRHLKPRLVPIRLHPFKQQIRNVAEQATFLSKLKATIDAEGHVCSKCESRMVLSAGSDKGKASLECTSCGHNVSLVIDPGEAMARSDKFMALSNQMFYVGLGLATASALLSAWNGSIFTFFGGLLLGILLWVQCAGFRYRSWQYANMRMYEAKSPFKEWLREELPFLASKVP